MFLESSVLGPRLFLAIFFSQAEGADGARREDADDDDGHKVGFAVLRFSRSAAALRVFWLAEIH